MLRRDIDRLRKLISSRFAQVFTVAPELVAQTDKQDALLIEQALIRYSGRADLGAGPLNNNTDVVRVYPTRRSAPSSI
jgi:hypothetical protein